MTEIMDISPYRAKHLITRMYERLVEDITHRPSKRRREYWKSFESHNGELPVSKHTWIKNHPKYKESKKQRINRRLGL